LVPLFGIQFNGPPPPLHTPPPPPPPDFTPDFAAPRYRTFQQGFPRLVKKDSSADSSIPSAVDHLEVTRVQGHFGSVTKGSFAKIAHINCGIGPLLEDDTMSYSHEDDVVAMVRSLIQAANSVLRLNVRVASELSVMKVRADLWILTQHGVPIGAVEVKKPDRSKVGVMHHGRVLGELYDQLLRLDHFYGTHLGIGILITGEEVRVCWRGNDEENVNVEVDEIIGGDLFAGADAPPETPSGADGPTEAPHTPRGAGAPLDGSAKRRSPPGLSTSPSKLNPRPHMLRPDGTPNADTKVTKMLKEERCMFVSDVVSCCDDTTDAMRLILSALIKMTRVRWAGLADPFADLETRYLICFVKDEQSSFWSRDLKALAKPKWDDMRVLGATHLYAVEDLGHGENGRVWLTATSSGYIYVLKIPRSAVNMEAECENWHNIYPEFKPYVAAEYWSGHTVLRMPHFAAIPEKDRSSFLTHIETCLKDKFDKKGWVHIDVKWRNIGQYTGPDGQAVAVVFDLSLRKKGVDDKNWVSECMRYLRDSL
jgi:hypothetical protein